MQAVICATTADRACNVIPYFSFPGRITVLFPEQHCKHTSHSLSNLFDQPVEELSRKALPIQWQPLQNTSPFFASSSFVLCITRMFRRYTEWINLWECLVFLLHALLAHRIKELGANCCHGSDYNKVYRYWQFSHARFFPTVVTECSQ
jgi:hypothetical protein